MIVALQALAGRCEERESYRYFTFAAFNDGFMVAETSLLETCVRLQWS